MPTRERYRVETLAPSHGMAGPLYRLIDEESSVRFSVAPLVGAEIAGIQTRYHDQWLEILDRAEDYSQCDRWRGRAPWLWPAVGRSYTPRKLESARQTETPPTEFEWEFEGRSYPMPIHGFVMHRQWKVTQSYADSGGAFVECTLADDPETRVHYPFAFLLKLLFRLENGIVKAVFRVEAGLSNTSAMPFCIGNHITLRAPLTGMGRFEDVQVIAPVRRVYNVTGLGLIGEPAELSFREGRSLADSRLHNLAVGRFAPDQASVRVVDPGGMQIEISQREITDGGSAKAPLNGFYYVFYALPEHRLFCPEPWLGLPNALNTRQPVVDLSPGQSFDWEMTVRITRN